MECGCPAPSEIEYSSPGRPVAIGQDLYLYLPDPNGEDASTYNLTVVFSTDRSGPPVTTTASVATYEGGDGKIIKVVAPAADTVGFTAGEMFGEVWRTDTGNNYPMRRFRFEVIDPILEPETLPTRYAFGYAALGSVTNTAEGTAPLTLANVYAAYRFNGNLNDSSGNGNDLQLYEFGAQTPAAYGAGHMGQCLTSGGALAGIQNSGGIGYEFSVSVWVNLNGSAGAELFSFWGKNGQCVFGVTGNGNGTASVNLPQPVGLVGSFTDNGWHHIVFTSSQPGGSGAITEAVYVDGVLVDDGSYFYFGFGNNFRIGSDFGGQTSSGVSCKVDMMLMWMYILDQDDINTVYNGGAGYDPTA